jgi:hypothetical protein
MENENKLLDGEQALMRALLVQEAISLIVRMSDEQIMSLLSQIEFGEVE